MIETKEFYEEFEKRLIQWGQEQHDIRAAFIVGSRARTDHPADECSNLDIVLYTSRPEYYLREKGWLTFLS